MVPSDEEKRRQARHGYGQSVTYTSMVKTPSGSLPQEVPFHGRIVDLSKGGIGIETTGYAFMEVGTLVRTWIPMSSVPVEVPVLTRVQWIRDKHPGASQLIGLKFVL